MSAATVDRLGEFRMVLPMLRPEVMAHVREIVRAQLRMWRKGEFSDVVELGVTELLSNVLLHTTGGGELVVRETADGVRVGVIDFDDRLPEVREQKSDATGGRGLHLLTCLVGELETEVLPRGKEIGFSLRSALGKPPADWPVAQESGCRGVLPGTAIDGASGALDSWVPRLGLTDGPQGPEPRSRALPVLVSDHVEDVSMPEKVTKDKVLVYVVRDGRLLVFRHTDYSYEEVGIQVPAGSIRPGESPEAAALREAREETGLTEFKIVSKLGETEYDISPYRFEIQHRHVFHLELTEPTPERWMSQEDHDGEQEPTHFECFWIPLEAAHILQSGQGALLGLLSD